MHGIYKLEEMLCDELDQLGQKEELTAGALETADKLAHSLKNVQKIIEYYETMGDDYSNAQGGNRGGNMGNSYRYSYRDSRGRGSYARKRDSRGRYSRNYSRAGEDMVQELHELMNEAPNDNIRRSIEELIKEVEMA